MNLATAIPESRFTPPMRALYDLMSDISERCYCAGWMHSNEFRLWSAITDSADDLKYGQDTIDQEDIESLRWLSEQCGGWIVWGDDEQGLSRVEDWGPYFLPLDEWKARYAYETEVHARERVDGYC